MRKLIAVLLVLTPCSALAWGNLGHQIVASVAEDRLSPAVRSAAISLLDGQHLSQVASDPDGWRKNPGGGITGSWHFVEIDIANPAFDPATDCAFSDCVIDRIAVFQKILADRTQQRAKRKEALIYLIHFVGDLHQPLHCGHGTTDQGKSDLGGNLVNVFVDGQQTNLHAVWDTNLLASENLSAGAFARHLERDTLGDRDADALAAGTPREWADEAHRIAIDAYVRNNTRLDDAYFDKWVPKVDEQLLLAALRLTRLLEETLAP